MKIKLGNLYFNNLMNFLHISRQIVKSIILVIIKSYLTIFIIGILAKIIYFMMSFNNFLNL